MTHDDDKAASLQVRRITMEDSQVVITMAGALFAELRDDDVVPEYRLDSVETVLRDSERSFGFVATSDEGALGLLMLAEAVAIFAGRGCDVAGIGAGSRLCEAKGSELFASRLRN